MRSYGIPDKMVREIAGHSLERIITSPLVDFGLLHQYVENSDLLSIFGVLHPLPLLPIIILV